MLDFMKKAILEHKATYSDSHMRDFIDMYIQRMKNQVGDLHSQVFTDNQLLLTGMDMILATSSALPSTMTFLFHCLLHHPEVQKKVQSELDEVVGRDRPATLDDRQRCCTRTILFQFVRSFSHLCTLDETYISKVLSESTVCTKFYNYVSHQYFTKKPQH